MHQRRMHASTSASHTPAQHACMQVPEPVDAAEELGLSGSAPDGHLVLLQMPPLLPSLPLFEDAQRAALEEPLPGAPLPEGIKPLPRFAQGPEMLKKIPLGKVQAPPPPRHACTLHITPCIAAALSPLAVPMRAVEHLSIAALMLACDRVQPHHSVRDLISARATSLSVRATSFTECRSRVAAPPGGQKRLVCEACTYACEACVESTGACRLGRLR
jgi:hypothetical protein